MYIIFTDAYIPYEYKKMHDCLRHVENMSRGIPRSIRLVEKDTEHLLLRCPVSGEYLDILASPEELETLHRAIIKKNLYRL